MLSLPAATSRKKPITISCSSSFWPSTSAWTRTLVRSSVGFSRRSAIIAPQRAKICCDRLLDRRFDVRRAVGAVVGVAGRQRRVHQLGPDRVVLLGDAHEAADHPRDRGLGDVGDQVAGLAALEPVEHAGDDLADLVLVGGDPLRREAGLEERLEPVVLGRVHADEHRPRQLDREDLVDHDDAAEFGGVGLPVAADRVDVVGAWSPTRSRCGRELGHFRGPVDGALAAHLLEELLGRAARPSARAPAPARPRRPLLRRAISVWSATLRAYVLAGWPVLGEVRPSGLSANDYWGYDHSNRPFRGDAASRVSACRVGTTCGGSRCRCPRPASGPRAARGLARQGKGLVWERPLRREDRRELGEAAAEGGDPRCAGRGSRREGGAAGRRRGRLLHDAALRRLRGRAGAAGRDLVGGARAR